MPPPCELYLSINFPNRSLLGLVIHPGGALPGVVCPLSSLVTHNYGGLVSTRTLTFILMPASVPTCPPHFGDCRAEAEEKSPPPAPPLPHARAMDARAMRLFCAGRRANFTQ